MTRCDSCNSILTKTDLVCYGCGDPNPAFVKRGLQGKFFPVFVTLALFASLGLAAFSFFSDRVPSFLMAWPLR
jgi:hypothetical protein